MNVFQYHDFWHKYIGVFSLAFYFNDKVKCLQDIKRGGGGDLFLWIINDTLCFLRKNNLSLLFLRKINWGSYEKIIRFYFLYELLKEFIFFKKIS